MSNCPLLNDNIGNSLHPEWNHWKLNYDNLYSSLWQQIQYTVHCSGKGNTYDICKLGVDQNYTDTEGDKGVTKNKGIKYKKVKPRAAPDIRPARYPAFFDIRYPAGYPVSFAGYPVGRIAGHPARKTLHGIFFLQNLGPH